jgi:hypothetical protein
MKFEFDLGFYDLQSNMSRGCEVQDHILISLPQ